MRTPFRTEALALLLLLAACAPTAPEPPPAASFRDRSVPVSSTTRGGPADLSGEWVVSSGYAGQPFARPGTRITVAPDGSSWRFAAPGISAATVPTSLAGPGRYEAGATDLWILWVDDDFRTAVVGTPSGAFGWVMDRPGQASPDRLAAAREILDFNGYDLGRLSGPGS